ncbi:LysR family transcriptional regulator [Arenimonas soli]|uniref:LysR family transcriptional regulator n=1 Tax=Arenimonas soli TaxID=2269504 RepID=A0ABQ1HK72_9GAMM|nr:LysR family transcriptional regulator [Arenimonas soli]GGA79870.1 LysR family transcriptional regulator [Arenimonas soli]
MESRVQWNDLQFFVAVCEYGSIGAAAQALGVNHSTVLRRLGSLEQALDVRLFDRLPGGYALTVQGHELASGIAGVSEQLEAAGRRVTGNDLALRGSIRLTAPDTLMQALLMSRLAAFSAEHPQLQLDLVVNDSMLNLTRREADVAVRGSNRPPGNLVGRRVGTIETALYASAAYIETLGPAPGESAYRWIGHAEPLSHLASARWLRENVAPEKVVLRVDSLISLADAVAAGFGVGWLLCPLAEVRPGLVQLRPPPRELDTQVWVLTHPDLRRVARVRALTEFLYETLSADPRLRHDRG